MEGYLKVALVEDEESSALTILNYFKRYMKERYVVIRPVRFYNGEEFLEKYQPDFDVVFMDIMMPGINGMETAKRLRKMDNMVTLIFVTNLAKFAVKGYEVDAIDFIVKPVVYDSFKMKMDKAVKIATSYSLKKIVIHNALGTTIIAPMDIYYIEVYNHNLIYYTKDGQIESYGTLGSLEKELKEYNFSRASSSFLVNLRYVDAVMGSYCCVNKRQIPFGRTKKKSFLTDLSNYLGRGI